MPSPFLARVINRQFLPSEAIIRSMGCAPYPELRGLSVSFRKFNVAMDGLLSVS